MADADIYVAMIGELNLDSATGSDTSCNIHGHSRRPICNSSNVQMDKLYTHTIETRSNKQKCAVTIQGPVHFIA